jgi:uncharacterized protein YuzE
MKKFTYDPEADAIGIYFTPDGATYAESEEIAPGVSLDYDTEGRVIGVEILGVRGIVAGHETREVPKIDVKTTT